MTAITTSAERLQHFNVHTIDNNDDNVSKVNIATDDFKIYTRKLYMQFFMANNKRSYIFKRVTTEIATIIQELLDCSNNANFPDIFEEKTEAIAKRLLDSQKIYASRFPGINAPKKGNLVTTFSKSDEKIDILISKIDQENFISLEDSLYKTGLPDKKATQKSCSISYNIVDDEYVLDEIILTDTGTSISEFWYQEFLELEELTNNEVNTTNAFNAVDNLLTRQVKKHSKKDYAEIRNNLVGYFQTKSSFKLDDMVEYVFGDYKPESDKVDLSKVKVAIESLPTKKKGFDTAFDITVGVIKARFKRTYKVSDKIELRTSEYIQDLKDTISAKENHLGEKVLEIKGIDDDLYETFKLRED